MIPKTKALIKDLELQIDYLCGYAPQGIHWKAEYHFRKDLIDDVLHDDSTPVEIKEKITRIQTSLAFLRSGVQKRQPYLQHVEQKEVIERVILVNDMGSKSYFLYI